MHAGIGQQNVSRNHPHARLIALFPVWEQERKSREKALLAFRCTIVLEGALRGLDLSRGSRTTFQKPLPSPPIRSVAEARVGSHPDDTTLIPRPPHYDVPRHNPSVADHFTTAGAGGDAFSAQSNCCKDTRWPV